MKLNLNIETKDTASGSITYVTFRTTRGSLLPLSEHLNTLSQSGQISGFLSGAIKLLQAQLENFQRNVEENEIKFPIGNYRFHILIEDDEKVIPIKSVIINPRGT